MSKDVNGSLVRWSCVQRNRKSLPVEKNKTEVQREAEMREFMCLQRNRGSSFEEQAVRCPNGLSRLGSRSKNSMTCTLPLSFERHPCNLIINLPSLLNLALVSLLFSTKIILA